MRLLKLNQIRVTNVLLTAKDSLRILAAIFLGYICQKICNLKRLRYSNFNLYSNSELPDKVLYEMLYRDEKARLQYHRLFRVVSLKKNLHHFFSSFFVISWHYSHVLLLLFSKCPTSTNTKISIHKRIKLHFLHIFKL